MSRCTFSWVSPSRGRLYCSLSAGHSGETHKDGSGSWAAEDASGARWDAEPASSLTLWEVVVTDERATRVVGTHLCRIEYVPSWGSRMYVRVDTGEPFLELGDSLITKVTRIYPGHADKTGMTTV